MIGGLILGFIMGTITGVFSMTALAVGVIDEKRKEVQYFKEQLKEQAEFNERWNDYEYDNNIKQNN